MSSPHAGLTRLNYFNGMRLEAPDLKVEQHYHVDVQRRLMHALFSPGIAEGLEVTVSENDAHHVVVSAGLALDHDGRVIALDEPREIPVRGVPSHDPGWVFGNYLVAYYEEHREAEERDGCQVQSGCCETAWGGPTRIVARPAFRFQNSWPNDAIVLGQIELDASCAVKAIRSGVRKYAIPNSSAARSFALEGEREIDNDNPKRLFFHLQGPTRNVMLYLRAQAFSTLFYSELGEHSHSLAMKTHVAGGSGDHDHSLEGVITAEEGDHNHDVVAFVDAENSAAAFELNDPTLPDKQDLSAFTGLDVEDAGKHHHGFPEDAKTGPGGLVPPHDHAITGATSPVGQSGTSPRIGAPYAQINDLQVLVDGVDLTPNILDHLGGAPNWTSLGDGSASHLLVTEGTAIGIPLDRLGMDVTEGAHVVELRVPKGSGGTIHYNLYVD